MGSSRDGAAAAVAAAAAGGSAAWRLTPIATSCAEAAEWTQACAGVEERLAPCEEGPDGSADGAAAPSLVSAARAEGLFGSVAL